MSTFNRGKLGAGISTSFTSPSPPIDIEPKRFRVELLESVGKRVQKSEARRSALIIDGTVDTSGARFVTDRFDGGRFKCRIN